MVKGRANKKGWLLFKSNFHTSLSTGRKKPSSSTKRVTVVAGKNYTLKRLEVRQTQGEVCNMSTYFDLSL